jgi:hypothetical protein
MEGGFFDDLCLKSSFAVIRRSVLQQRRSFAVIRRSVLQRRRSFAVIRSNVLHQSRSFAVIRSNVLQQSRLLDMKRRDVLQRRRSLDTKRHDVLLQTYLLSPVPPIKTDTILCIDLLHPTWITCNEAIESLVSLYVRLFRQNQEHEVTLIVTNACGSDTAYIVARTIFFGVGQEARTDALYLGQLACGKLLLGLSSPGVCAC